MSEPSNPWVSGVSGLFTTEFYGRMRQYLTDDGVFGQWLHVYELDDALVLSVLAAIHQNFRSYEVYLVPSGDLLVVASNRDALPAPDWSVFQAEGLRSDLCRFTPLTPPVLDALRSCRGRSSRRWSRHGQPNSDYYPVLDLGAERRRFRRDHASGFPALSDEWFNLLASLTGGAQRPAGEPLPALPENPRVRARALGALVRSPAAQAASDSLLGGWPIRRSTRRSMWQAMWPGPDAERLGVVAGAGEPGGPSSEWRHGGDGGRARSTPTRPLHGSSQGPAAARDVVAFRHGIAAWNFAEASAAADRLMPVVLKEHKWIAPDELRDGLVIRTAAPARRGRGTAGVRYAQAVQPTACRRSAFAVARSLRDDGGGNADGSAARRYAGATLTSTCSS